MRMRVPAPIGKAVVGFTPGDFPFYTGHIVMFDGCLVVPRLQSRFASSKQT